MELSGEASTPQYEANELSRNFGKASSVRLLSIGIRHLGLYPHLQSLLGLRIGYSGFSLVISMQANRLSKPGSGMHTAASSVPTGG